MLQYVRLRVGGVPTTVKQATARSYPNTQGSCRFYGGLTSWLQLVEIQSPTFPCSHGMIYIPQTLFPVIKLCIDGTRKFYLRKTREPLKEPLEDPPQAAESRAKGLGFRATVRARPEQSLKFKKVYIRQYENKRAV